MNILLIANSAKPEAVAAGRSLSDKIQRLAPADKVSYIEGICEADLRNLADRPDLIVLLGGDGTILEAARFLAPYRAPVAGVNFGKLGYMAAFTLEQFENYLPDLLSGKNRIMPRLMLEAFVYRAGASSHPGDAPAADVPIMQCMALNDVVVNAGAPFRMVELTVCVDGTDTATFRGDGIIISTASGSTGYNLSAGGPLIAPDVGAMVITPICAHSLSFRPVVVRDCSVISLKPRRLNEGSHVVLDGIVANPLRANQYVLVKRAANPLLLIENPAQNHWKMLAQKLHWAHNPQAGLTP